MSSILLIGLGIGINFLVENKETREKTRVYLNEIFDGIKAGWNKHTKGDK